MFRRRENELRMDRFAECNPDLAAHAHSLQLRFPPFLDCRDMFSMVEDFINVHKLRKIRGLEIEVLSLLRKATRYPEHAVLHKNTFGVSLHQEVLRTRFPNLRYIEMVYSEDSHQQLVVGSQLRLSGQSFTFDESFYDGNVHPFALDSEWMKIVCLAAPKQVTSFKFEGLRLGGDFADNLALIPHTKHLDLSFIDTEEDLSYDYPLFCPCCVGEWQSQLTAMPELVDLRLAFRSDWTSVSQAVLQERHFPYLDDVLPPLTKLRKLSVAKWPVRLAKFCEMVQALQSDQVLDFPHLLIDIKGTEMEVENIPTAMLLSVVMARKQISVESAFVYCINHDHGRGPRRAIVGYSLDNEDIAEALADAEGLASKARETGSEDHMMEFRMELMMNTTEAVDNAYNRLDTWVASLRQ
ncbi:MAG: hypothetical protein LQ343_004149 [Gyalolechia ehrenbergii]|nr:MAG: hypothetical protein LQ343_004149 [Gyalolechia ehrenbergii]